MDLAGHTAGNRALVFARKPAPVQATYLGYLSTTGMATIDYRITDAQADPPGMTERFHTEALVYLPEIALCYKSGPAPAVSGLPALSANGLMFGSFNVLAKVTPAVIAMWSRVLARVHDSRLMMMAAAGNLTDQGFREAFAGHGIEPERIVLVGRTSRFEYLERYQKVDLCLDPFPYNGVTTTCDGLWMGVPLITLPGKTSFSRQGASFLSHLGLAELIANSQEEYVEIAAWAASHLGRLNEWRAGLRETMKKSTITDGPRFTRHLEEAYSRIWQTWCSSQGKTGRLILAKAITNFDWMEA